MATIRVSEDGVTFPKWAVAATFVALLSLAVTAGANIIHASWAADAAVIKADGAIAVNVLQDTKIERLNSAFIELASQRSDITSLQKSQDRMDAKLDRILEAQSRSARR